MSILIKGFPLPNNCGACPLRLAWCRERIYMVTRPKRCPLVPIPPHGRLIDADALTKEINDRIEAAIKWGVNAIADRDDEIKTRAEQAVATFCEASLAAKKLPTIIPADKEGEA